MTHDEHGRTAEAGMTRDATETIVGFARTLRAAGVDAGPDRVQAMVEALRDLDVLNPRDVYWAGRLTTCAGPDDLDRYDRCFAAYFADRRPGPPRRAPQVTVYRQVAVPAPQEDAREETGPERDKTLAAASGTEVLRARDVARLTASERAEVNRLIALLDAEGTPRRSLRYTPARRGALDRERTVRAMLRRGGETSRLYHRAHRYRPRRVVMLVDVSGSMSPYADALLRFAHVLVRRRGRGAEVFSVGTRLTRLTRELRQRDVDAAMAAVSSTIPDWSGGTRLGDELKEFSDQWGQRGMARGAVLIIASDGWERGDVTQLAAQMARLSRLAHRVVWVNPHKAQPGYEPLTAGMRTVLPFVDDFVEGHSLGALEELALLIGREHTGGRRA